MTDILVGKTITRFSTSAHGLNKSSAFVQNGHPEFRGIFDNSDKGADTWPPN
jgi:hypothetical protein